jgi:hypothetical protein
MLHVNWRNSLSLHPASSTAKFLLMLIKTSELKKYYFKLLICCRRVFGWGSVDLGTGNPNNGSWWFSLVPPREDRKSTFLPSRYSLITISFNSTRYIRKVKIYKPSKNAKEFFSEMAVLSCEIGTVWQSRVHRSQSRQCCARSVCLKLPCRFKIPPNVMFVQ